MELRKRGGKREGDGSEIERNQNFNADRSRDIEPPIFCRRFQRTPNTQNKARFKKAAAPRTSKAENQPPVIHLPVQRTIQSNPSPSLLLLPTPPQRPLNLLRQKQPFRRQHPQQHRAHRPALGRIILLRRAHLIDIVLRQRKDAVQLPHEPVDGGREQGAEVALDAVRDLHEGAVMRAECLLEGGAARAVERRAGACGRGLG